MVYSTPLYFQGPQNPQYQIPVINFFIGYDFYLYCIKLIVSYPLRPSLPHWKGPGQLSDINDPTNSNDLLNRIVGSA